MCANDRANKGVDPLLQVQVRFMISQGGVLLLFSSLLASI